MPKVLQFFFSRLIDAIVERILAFEDYFCRFNALRLSELYLFAQSASWFIWFLIFKVEGSSPVFQYMVSETFWTALFGTLSATHLAGVFFGGERWRSRVVTAYALVWFLWSAIASYAEAAPTGTPTMFNLSVLSIAVAIHLSLKTER